LATVVPAPAAPAPRRLATAARDRPAVCAALVAVMAVGGFALDGVNTLETQSLFGVAAFAALALVLLTVPAEVRIAACVMGVIATVTEILFAGAWGMYEYRLGNIPSFVPGGHALVFACVWRLATADGTRSGRRFPRGATIAAVVAIAAFLVRQPDDAFGLVSLAGWLVLLAVVPRHRAFLVWMMLAVLLVEGSGTLVGAWTWEDAAPGTGLSMANPPVGIAAWYCALDLLALAAAAAVRGRR
jgi:hypothetical protein